VTLITDVDGDQEVDTVIHYYFLEDKYLKESEPRKLYPKESFIKIKTDIINGAKSEKINPNLEGAVFLKKLVSARSKKAEVSKAKQGYSIKVVDADETNLTRLLFMFSDNGVYGVDLVFFVAYNNVMETRVQPVIQYSVYCQNSTDPVVKEAVTSLLKLTSDNFRLE
jgi:hypothetical protein